jgi:hypothetical protein
MGSLIPATEVTTCKTEIWDRLHKILNHGVKTGHSNSVDPKHRIPATIDEQYVLNTGYYLYLHLVVQRSTCVSSHFCISLTP